MASLQPDSQDLLVRAALGETLSPRDASRLTRLLADGAASRFLAEARATARLVARFAPRQRADESRSSP